MKISQADGSPTQGHSLLVVIPTLNEAENISLLFSKIVKSELKNFQKISFLIVDDNSHDNPTKAIQLCRELGFDIDLISRPRKLGLGSAHRLGYRYFLRENFTVLVTMDADLSHDPTQIQVLANEVLKGADLVIGSRWTSGGQCEYGWLRRNVSRSANFLSRILAVPGISDSTSAFRAYSRDAVRELVSNPKPLSNSYSFFLETASRLSKSSMEIVEKPIVFIDRQHGSSKIPRAQIFQSSISLFQLSFSRFCKSNEVKKIELTEICPICRGMEIEVKFNPENLEKAHEAMGSKSNFLCVGNYGFRMPVLFCLRCSAKFSPPSTWPGILEAHYESIEDSEYEKYQKIKSRTFEGALKVASKYATKSSKILEIGSYGGTFLDVASSNGYVVRGIEVSSWGKELCLSKGHDVTQISVERFIENNQENETYDLIVSWDVLEHLVDPVKVLQGLSNTLNLDGKIILSTLDSDSSFARTIGNRWPWIIPMHLHYFGHESFEDLLKLAGLELIESGKYPHFASLSYIIKKVFSSYPIVLKLFKSFDYFLEKIVLKISLGDIKYFVVRVC